MNDNPTSETIPASASICSYNTERLMACLEIGKLLTSTLNLHDILKLIMTRLSELVEAQNWSLFLKDPVTDELTFEIVVGLDDTTPLKNLRLQPGQGVAGYIAQTGEPLFIEDVQQDTRFSTVADQKTGFRTRSIVGLPIQIHGHILGVLEVINVPNIKRFKGLDYPFLRILADYAAIAIQNSRNFNYIQDLSRRDEYTGLYNARHMYAVLEQLLKDAWVNSENLAVVFVDVDNFKEVVDTYGHLQGSQVLRDVGQTIQGCMAEKDLVFKYGGDEYVIVLPQCNQTEALASVQKILTALNTATYLVNDTLPIRVTASFGIAVYPDDASDSKDLLLKADNSMYDVKRTGKNAVGICTVRRP